MAIALLAVALLVAATLPAILAITPGHRLVVGVLPGLPLLLAALGAVLALFGPLLRRVPTLTPLLGPVLRPWRRGRPSLSPA